MNKQDKEIYGLLTELRNLGRAFNQMVGNLYPSIFADDMNKIMYKLGHKFHIEVKWIQPSLHYIEFKNLNKLIEKYEKKEKQHRKGNRANKTSENIMQQV